MTLSPSFTVAQHTTDAVVVGGGHNGLVAAAYLGRLGLRVTVLERLDRLGGATVSDQVFPGVEANLSRYSYLVSLLPYSIVRDLELDLELRSRPVASYTPVRRDSRADGFFVGRAPDGTPGQSPAESFRRLTGSDREWQRWQEFYAQIELAARALAPTLLDPLIGRGQAEKLLRRAVGHRFWSDFVEHPLGEVIERTFEDDDVRGIVLTDALIGTQSHAHDPSLRQNQCFLYHVIGNGSGEWRVPIGGMGAVSGSLIRCAQKAGVQFVCSAEATKIESDGAQATVTYTTPEGTAQLNTRYVLVNAAPPVMDRLLGRPPRATAPGSQLKINMVLDRLPRFRSGLPAEQAFAGTLHLDESYSALGEAYRQSERGQVPDPLPSEVYCHTLTDRTILSPAAAARGMHTLTLFGLHTPPSVFAEPGSTELAVQRALAGLNKHLVDPVESCLALDENGKPCLEARTPLDLEEELAMPGGNIFHGDLTWPWAEDSARIGSWGVETGLANVFLCGAGAARGGAVSGIPGRAAVFAVIQDLQKRTPPRRSGRRGGGQVQQQTAPGRRDEVSPFRPGPAKR
ncbi:MAG TPA: NAD(P)/FAD-dependent oxidoreductase [Actinocrinis sp.]|nr:NAD(P)/FAD-dependent oxidoreductase [Actinocrinis sp.]